MLFVTDTRKSISINRILHKPQGWKYFVRETLESADLWGITGDGYRIKYFIQASGVYSIQVFSELFWTNDAHALSVIHKV
ncbi:hypothetical protein C5D07_15120 [Rathayibacter tritici]|uniref:hypothetical protein n=1 Tax=Rathayibacter tritici TaxID=33888 RepID=UPI000CE738A2|nr:hypothetical protein [Rathayibacter tritici]PPI10069.1 hypothetical protein C5D07_15120 [Rathayibacter tritici]